MTTLLSKKQFSRIFSSANANNPINKSEDGTIFSIQLDQPIMFPNDSFDCTAEVVGASVWNTVPNVSVNLANNRLYVFYSGTLYTVVLPDGLYSVSSLNAQVMKSLVNQGLPGDVVSIIGNQSTQRIVLSFNYVGSYVDFTGSNSCKNLLGFDSRLVPVAPTTIVSQSEDGDSTAQFNNIESFLIKSDLVSGNIPTNKDSEQTIALIPINAKTGDQILYNPYNASRVDASNLKGLGRTYATFRLTDEKGSPAITNEDFSIQMVFRYSVFQQVMVNRSEQKSKIYFIFFS